MRPQQVRKRRRKTRLSPQFLIASCTETTDTSQAAALEIESLSEVFVSFSLSKPECCELDACAVGNLKNCGRFFDWMKISDRLCIVETDPKPRECQS
jgi:hypothetical protein